MKKLTIFLLLVLTLFILSGCGKKNNQDVQNKVNELDTYKVKYVPYFYETFKEQDVSAQRTFEFQGRKYETTYIQSYNYGYNDMTTHEYKCSEKIGDNYIHCAFQVIDDTDKLYWEQANYTEQTSEEDELNKQEITNIINDYASQYISVDEYETIITEHIEFYSAEFFKEYGEYKAFRYLTINCNKKGVIELVIKEPILELDNQYIIKKIESFDNSKSLELVEKEVVKQTGKKAKNIYEQYITAINGELVMRYSVITDQDELVAVLVTW